MGAHYTLRREYGYLFVRAANNKKVAVCEIAEASGVVVEHLLLANLHDVPKSSAAQKPAAHQRGVVDPLQQDGTTHPAPCKKASRHQGIKAPPTK